MIKRVLSMNKKGLTILFVTFLVLAGCGNGDGDALEERQADLADEKEEVILQSEEEELELEGKDTEEHDSSGMENTEGGGESNTQDEAEPDSEIGEHVPSKGDKIPPRNDEVRPITDFTTMSAVIGEKFQPSVEYTTENGVVKFLFKVKNTSDHFFSMHFDTTQRFEYVITDEDKNVVKTYSSFATFEKMPGEEPLKPGGSLQYEVEVPDLPKGKYHITFILMAKEFQPKTGIDFEVK
jgi:hypothetical protein